MTDANVMNDFDICKQVMGRLQISGNIDILHGLTLATNKTFTAPFLTLEALHNQTIISLGSFKPKPLMRSASLT